MLDKDAEFSAGEVVNGRGRERDGEVTQKTNRSRCPSHLRRAGAKDAGRDPLEDPERSGTDETEPNKSLRDVEDASEQPAPEDRSKGIGTSFAHASVLTERLSVRISAFRFQRDTGGEARRKKIAPR